MCWCIITLTEYESTDGQMQRDEIKVSTLEFCSTKAVATITS